MTPIDKIKEDDIVYIPVFVKDELPTKEGYFRTLGREMSSYFHLDRGDNGQFEDSWVTHWLKPVSVYSIVEDKTKVLVDALKRLQDFPKNTIESEIIETALKGYK